MTLKARLKQMANDLDRAINEQLNLITSFQPDPTEPGQRFGIADWIGSDSDGDEFSQQETHRFQLWVVASFETYSACRDGMIDLAVDVRNIIPTLKLGLEDVLMVDYPSTVSVTKRAPIPAPNTQTGHLWVGDIVVPLAVQMAVFKGVAGGYLD
ncbi:hypothetical protein [Pantanalinema sp. GBBB05]|uniref:hypothetical protein n=1 Tax=Pantanalinema sp. GBBB05 TaxID=2604139 RepID=UPI001D991500|nr:hypothetical protein [Pantanalinema sp. GBBB05]